jgi:O-antigen ligase
MAVATVPGRIRGAVPPSVRNIGTPVLVALCLIFTLAGLATGHPNVAAGVLGLGAYVYLAATRPGLAVAVLVLYGGVVSGFLKTYAPNSTVVVASADGLAAVLIAVSLWKGRMQTRFTAVHYVVGSFVVLVLGLAVFNPLAPRGLQLVGGVRTEILYPCLFFVAAGCLRSRSARQQFINAVLITTAVLGAISIVQYAAGPDWSIAHHLAQRITRDYATSAGSFRPASLLAVPGVAGSLFGCGALFATLWLVRPLNDSTFTRWAAYGALVFDVAGLAVSGQRSGNIGFAVGLVVLILLTRSRILLSATSVGVGLLIIVALILPSVNPYHRVTTVGGQDSARSLNLRVATWRHVLTQLPDYPLGHGPGYTGSAATRFGASGSDVLNNVVTDNVWIKLLYETGIPGALWYAALLISAIVLGIREARRQSWWGVLLLALIAHQMVTGFFSNMLDPVPYTVIFWSVLGVTAASALRPAATEHLGIRQSTDSVTARVPILPA